MIDLSKFVNGEDEIQLATVKEVISGVGVKIQIDGESSPRETYYKSLVVPNVNDRVFFIKTGETILIIGSLKF